MRLLKIVDFNDRNFDSCLPSFDDITTFSAVVSPFSYNGNRVPAFITTADAAFEESLPGSEITQFPFVSNPQRNVQLSAAVITGSESATFKGGYFFEYPPGVTGQGDDYDSMLNIFKTRFSYFSTTPSRKNYEIWNPPYRKIGSRDEYDLSDNLTAYYRASGLAASALLSLDNSVPGSSANSGLEEVAASDPPFALVGSPLFPAAGGFGGYGNTILFNGSGAPVSAAATDYLRSVGSATALTMGLSSTDVDFTLSVVFKLTEIGTNPQYLIEKSKTGMAGSRNFEYSLSVNTDGTISFKKGRSTPDIESYVEIISDLTAPIVVDEWHHVVATFRAPDDDDDISRFKIFINGVNRTDHLTAFGSPTDAAFDTATRLRVGVSILSTDVDPNAAIRNGQIHSIGIWKQRALTSSEVEDLYYFELTGSAIGQVRHRIGPDNIEKASALRYGISNVNPEFATTAWNPTHFGYARDMIEPRRLTAAADGTAPIKIRFMSGSALILDATNTHAQNLDTAATSSLPFFDDGIARNRDDNPDETLLSV